MPNIAAHTDPRTIAETLTQRLQDAWNAADGAAFGAPFAADADFVDIRGERHSGPAIAAGHQQIFDTIYAGSTVRYTLLGTRELDDRVLLAHVGAHLSVPAGPRARRAGEHRRRPRRRRPPDRVLPQHAGRRVAGHHRAVTTSVRALSQMAASSRLGG